MADTNSKPLFAEFPGISTEQWMEKITTDLKGADFAKKLVWRTNEGFNVNPFYRTEDLAKSDYLNTNPGSFPYTRGTKSNSNAWLVRQDITVKDVAVANAKMLNILGKGVTSVGLCFHDSSLATKENMAILFNEVCLEELEVNFTLGKGKVELVEAFVAYVTEKGFDLDKVSGSFNFDPYGRMLKKGALPCENMVARFSQFIEATKALPKFRTISVNAKYVNNAGGSIGQELGYGLAMGAEYLSTLTENGVSAYDAAINIKFNFGISSNYFMEIAKFRAARFLWAKIVEQYKPTCECDDDCCKDNEDCCNDWCKCAAAIVMHAETSKWNMTTFDPNVNMLRSQTEAMSASLGGVNSLTVLPYDTTYKASDEFSERIARNQQLLLKEESYFDKVVDPAGGSYYIETLTDSIAEQAWGVFLSTQDNGGFVEAAKAGAVQEDIEATGEKRVDAIATRREILLGTNQYPNFTETVGSKIEEKSSCCCSTTCAEGEINALDFTRGSEAFENMRLATEKTDKTPIVFMLKVGSVPFRQARAQFATNFFGCAGYNSTDNLGFNTVEEGVAAAMEAKADVVVICASDDDYVTAAPAAYELLKDKAVFVVAGAPKCTDDLKAVGIENFIHVRSNVLEELKGYNEKLGIN